jgi:hypothetical protein
MSSPSNMNPSDNPSAMTNPEQPVSVSEELPGGMSASPFPDHKGAPVYVPMAQESELGSPFPSGDGKPIVVPATQPTSVGLPFPDAQGRPVYVPYTPNQRPAEGPFPATPLKH